MGQKRAGFGMIQDGASSGSNTTDQFRQSDCGMFTFDGGKVYQRVTLKEALAKGRHGAVNPASIWDSDTYDMTFDTYTLDSTYKLVVAGINDSGASIAAGKADLLRYGYCATAYIDAGSAASEGDPLFIYDADAADNWMLEGGALATKYAAIALEGTGTAAAYKKVFVDTMFKYVPEDS